MESNSPRERTHVSYEEDVSSTSNSDEELSGNKVAGVAVHQGLLQDFIVIKDVWDWARVS